MAKTNTTDTKGNEMDSSATLRDLLGAAEYDKLTDALDKLTFLSVAISEMDSVYCESAEQGLINILDEVQRNLREVLGIPMK